MAASYIPQPCVILRQCRTKKHITPVQFALKDERQKSSKKDKGQHNKNAAPHEKPLIN
jgi:hypothetical protein